MSSKTIQNQVLHTLYTILIISKSLFLYFVLENIERGVFMNTKENKDIWIKKVEEILKLGGKSDDTIKTYKYGVLHFLNHFSDNTNISEFTEEDILKYLKTEYIDKDKASSTYNFYLYSIKFFIQFVSKEALMIFYYHLQNLEKSYLQLLRKKCF